MNKLDRKRPAWGKLSQAERQRESALLQRRQRELSAQLSAARRGREARELQSRIDAMQSAAQALSGRS